MRWKISVLLIAAMLCVALTGVAAAADIKCAWYPCGTKVVQADDDAVYTYMLQPAAQWAYYDYGGVAGVFDNGDTAYIDMDGNGVVSTGDVRLTAWHNVPVGDPDRKYEPNTKVFNDDDLNLPLVVPAQQVLSFVDLLGDGYDVTDPVYLDANGDGFVSTHDIRLSHNNPFNGVPIPSAYTTVKFNDGDRGEALTLIGPGVQNGVPANLLAFIDSDCSGSWTCPDKLYLKQPGPGPIDAVVTIGDLRLYIPPEAIVNEGWPSCGTKVAQKDIDAVYALMPQTQAQIGFWDYQGVPGQFDDADTAYIDMDASGTVTPGDVRLTAWHNVPVGDPDRKYEPNTKVFNDEDVNLPLVIPQQDGLIKYFDINGMWGYDIGDPVYVDIGGANCNNDVVSLYDVRLWVEDPGNPAYYEPYTTVAPNNMDLDRALSDVGHGDIADLIGYIDSDCSRDWTCPDKLYLEQPIKYEPNDNNPHPGAVDRLVTIGDIRLYMPDVTSPNYDPEWPECGTKVEQCDIDAVYRLKTLMNAKFGFFDYNIPGGAVNVFDDSDTGYMDMDGSGTVTPGDVRLTAWHNVPVGDPDRKYEPNTKVFNDEDVNLPLVIPPQGGLIKYFDINGMYGYDLNDPLYIDVDNSGAVSLYDIRLWVDPYTSYTTVAPGDMDLIEARVLLPVGNGVPADLMGYIDDDCTNSWTCPDKLYLQQPAKNWGFEMGDLTGWSVIAGNVEVLQADNFAPNIPVPQGQYYALLSTGPGDVTAGAIGLEDRDAGLGNENDTAILKRGFTTISPTSLTIELDFLTGEENQPLIFDDIFEVTLDGVTIVKGSVDQVLGVSSLWAGYGPYDNTTYTVTSPGPTSGSMFGHPLLPHGGRTGFTTYNVQVDPGQHIIEFYIGEQGNHLVDSGLLIDITAAPVEASDQAVTIGDDRLYMPTGPSVIPPDGMKGDFDDDGDVDFTDFSAFAGVYNTQMGGYGPGDFDDDGDVDFTDFSAFAGVYSP